MPSNKKENIIFGLFMCFGMVFIMSIYNTALHGFSSYMLTIIIFFITFVVAFIVESLVGPIAFKLAFSLSYDKTKELNTILAIALCMVPIMVLIMSFYGLILMTLTTGIEGSFFTNYLNIVGLNVIVALPSQLLIVGPISRKLLVKFVKPQAII